jgi:signal transduction histidine kinase
VVASCGLLVQAAWQAETSLVRKQVVVVLLGLVLPIFLALTSNFIMDYPVDLAFAYDALGKYGWIGLPFAAAIAMLRYQLFDLQRSNRLHVLFTGTIAAMLVSYFSLVALINPTSIRLSYIRIEDVRIIGSTVLVFFALRPLYTLIRQRLEQRFYGSVENFRIGLRLFQQELLRVKSRHDLEALVSWNIPADFRLRSAELSQRGRPSSPYALQLPILVNNVSLGTLYFGGKISSEEFTEREPLILVELQKQLALALWSLELDEAIRSTEELTRLKSKFMANVTHELRTPLNGIINYIGIVVDGDTGPLNPEQTSHLSQALQNAEKLLGLINNILDMSKIEAGQMTLQVQPVNLALVITEAIPTIADTLNDKPVQLQTDLAASLTDIPADRLRLRQIILNLLSNAAKFTDAGTVWLKAFPENDHIVIQVSDTGRGIRAELLPTIFQQFTDQGLTDQAEHGSVGLSLPVTKSLVEMHGGYIQVESQIGRGTTFTVTLPAEQK